MGEERRRRTCEEEFLVFMCGEVFMEKVCEELLHTFTIKICTHIKTDWRWNYYVVVV